MLFCAECRPCALFCTVVAERMQLVGSIHLKYCTVNLGCAQECMEAHQM